MTLSLVCSWCGIEMQCGYYYYYTNCGLVAIHPLPTYNVPDPSICFRTDD